MPKMVVVLAMHGTPPNDFPRPEVIELFSLHARLENVLPHIPDEQLQQWRQRHDELDKKIRNWPRTPENDPFFVASQQISAQLSAETGFEVLLGFNEFCAPDLDAALETAARRAERVIVVTPMMTPGGEHAEEDIPAAIQRAQEQHPAVDFKYAWPFDLRETAKFLAAQIKKVG
jgi:sirohydrochlorin cobaltochelatase